MKRLVFIVPIILILLCGCNEIQNPLDTERNKFIGTWKSEGEVTGGTTTFFSDGSLSSFGIGGTWELKDNKLVMIFGNSEMITAYNYYFTNDDTMNLKSTISNKYVIYHRQ